MLTPVVLEPEPDLKFVGVRLELSGTTVSALYVVGGFEEIRVLDSGQLSFHRAEAWRYRSTLSAGSRAVKMAGLLGRLHQAVRLSFPVSRARQGVVQLVAVYLALGHEKDDVKDALERVSKPYKVEFSNNFLEKIVGAMYCAERTAILDLEKDLRC